MKPSATSSDVTVEDLEVVTTSHGAGQELLESLLRFIELDRDAAWFEAHTEREVLKLSIYNGGRRFDHQLGLSHPLLPQVRDEVCHFAPALDLVRAFITVTSHQCCDLHRQSCD